MRRRRAGACGNCPPLSCRSHTSTRWSAPGGRAVVIPPAEEDVEETLDALDAIVFSGGADVDPSRYGADAHPQTDTPQTRRDAGELALLTAALERDLPTLAICRGFQLLNVARGGDLVQHLPEQVGSDDHKQVPGRFAVHPVEVKDGSRLSSIVGAGSDVTSHHHQGLGRVGEASSRRPGPRTGRSRPWRIRAYGSLLGVQWHPEAGQDAALFEALVEQARQYRAARTQ